MRTPSDRRHWFRANGTHNVADCLRDPRSAAFTSAAHTPVVARTLQCSCPPVRKEHGHDLEIFAGQPAHPDTFIVRHRAVAPHLMTVVLRVPQDMEWPNRSIREVYFPDTGVASVVAINPDGKQVEVGVIGSEGMTGVAVILGTAQSPHSTSLQ